MTNKPVTFTNIHFLKIVDESIQFDKQPDEESTFWEYSIVCSNTYLTQLNKKVLETWN